MNQRVVVLTLSFALTVFVVSRMSHTPVDVFPELNAPTVVIMTEAPGLAADEVEQYVSFPIETSVNGMSGVRRVRTSSAIGLSITYVEFDWDMDILSARQLVSERLDSVRESLPPDVHAEMTPITSITGEIMLLAVSSPDGSLSAMEVRAWAEYDLRNKLLSVPGVAQVSVIGGELPEYQILVKQDNLMLRGLVMEDVVEAARQSHSSLSAGYIPNMDSLELPVRQSGKVRSADDIASTFIRFENGYPLQIGHVADVKLGPAPKRGAGADGGKPAVILTIQKAPASNTLTITENIDNMLDNLESILPEGLSINRNIFRQADFIQLSVNNVVHALRDAAIIVAVILMLFLLNIRTTVITLTAIPLSLGVGLLVLDGLGMTLNVMSLGGLAIAVGSLVDDAIIGMENAFRRLKQNACLSDESRRPDKTVIAEAIGEVAPSIIFATVIIVIVFVPLFFLDGIEGRFFRPLGIAFIISILASLAVSLVVTPAMCSLLLKSGGPQSSENEAYLAVRLKRLYEPVVRIAIQRKWSFILSAMMLTIGTLILAGTFGKSFLPEFNEGTFTVGLFAPPGTSLQASDRIASSIESQILEIDGVRSVTRRTGRAEKDEHAEPVSNSEIDVTINSGFSKEEVRQKISAILEMSPGITSNIGQPIEHRLSHILSGTPAALAINVYGNDLSTLRNIAKEIESVLKPVPGLRDVTANREVMIQSIPVNYRLDDLAACGLTPLAAASQVRNAVHGVTVAEINDGIRKYDLSVRLDESERDEVSDLRNLIIRGQSGVMIRLHEIADVGPELTSNLIARENSQRKAVVTLNIDEGFNLGHIVGDVRKKVDPIVSKYGYTVKYGGQFEAQENASRVMYLSGAVVLVVLFMILNMAVGSMRVALLVLVNLPLSLIGGVVAIFLTESGNIPANIMYLLNLGDIYSAPVISIASLVGFITLFGIAVRNGILLVNHYNNLTSHGGYTVYDAIVMGSGERLIPILMTALTAALAVIPIAMQGDASGNEILAPLAVVILGGLLTSTFLNLVIVPAGYALIHRVVAPDHGQSNKV